MSKEKQLLIELMNIPSISDKELEFCNFVYLLLQNLNFDKLEKIPVDENGYNILASQGNPKVMLQAHMDTVAPFIPPTEKNDRIYGRGSCDTKGSMAGMITAAEMALSDGISDFALLFTVGEETDFRGIEKFVESKDGWPFTVVGEPTDLEVVSGQYGLLNLNVLAEGRRAHTSVPENGINAIDRLLNIIVKIKEIKLGTDSKRILATINGGIQDNIVPDKAAALFNLRINPDDKENYFARFQEIVDEYEGLSLEKGLDLPAVLTTLPKKLEFLGETKFIKGGTELSFLKNGIILGPGNMDMAHSDGEYVETDELIGSSQIYLEIIKAMTQ